MPPFSAESRNAALRPAGLRLLEERKRHEAAKLNALKQASRQGWADVSAGQYADVADDQLADFVGQLGRRAARTAETVVAKAINLAP